MPHRLNLQEQTPARPVPLRAIAISLGALAVPIVATVLDPESLPDYEALLWLLALVPAFLLAYYRGAAGVALALALGMSALSTAQAASFAIGRPLHIGRTLALVIGAYIAISLGVAWLSEKLQQDRETLEQMALTDALSGLANRRFCTAFLEKEFAAAQRGRVLSVALLDLDQFKAYNDAHGHAAGDDAIRAFSATMKELTRASALAARFGGEEFIAILPDTDADGALVYVERLRARIADARPPLGVTLSAGVAEFDPSMESPDALIAAADRALYHAKADGRDCVRVHRAPVKSA